ncbi:hypothetical protein OUZ56_027077 [Daphnia magna]|uniref:Uncharacterized protein n=1 Tax=Daphnia magna TaxID=35525 RepID=A0ABQ9ZNN2_9CRUS|nr:hypothetical protein OUZ56_027077 [Daphnia magna]
MTKTRPKPYGLTPSGRQEPSFRRFLSGLWNRSQSLLRSLWDTLFHSFCKTNRKLLPRQTPKASKPWVIDDILSGHNCVVNWYHFYKAKLI